MQSDRVRVLLPTTLRGSSRPPLEAMARTWPVMRSSLTLVLMVPMSEIELQLRVTLGRGGARIYSPEAARRLRQPSTGG